MGSFLTSNPGPELNFLTKEERKKVFPAGYCPMLEMRDRLSLPIMTLLYMLGNQVMARGGRITIILRE
jgi:hypothetical protein